MGSSNFWLLLLVGSVVCRNISESKGGRLSRQENRELLESCGRFERGHDENRTVTKSLYGRPASRGDAPWAAVIPIFFEGEFAGLASGTLISPRHILTSAHVLAHTPNDCEEIRNRTFQSNLAGFKIFLNTSCSTTSICKRLNRYDQLSPQLVKKVYVHKDYIKSECRGDRYAKDVAVFELSKDVKFSSEIYPACISTRSPETGDRGFVYGFGQDPSEKKRPDFGVLKTYKIAVSKTCDGDPHDYGDFYFCSKHRNGVIGCGGDSGSGVIDYVRTNDGIKKAEVFGIVTKGQNCTSVLEESEREYRTRTMYNLHMNVAYFDEFLCDCCGICAPRASSSSPDAFVPRRWRSKSISQGPILTSNIISGLAQVSVLESASAPQVDEPRSYPDISGLAPVTYPSLCVTARDYEAVVSHYQHFLNPLIRRPLYRSRVFFMSLWRASNRRCFGRPFGLFPATSIKKQLLATDSSLALRVWPYHLSLASLIFSVIGATPKRVLMSSFRTWCSRDSSGPSQHLSLHDCESAARQDGSNIGRFMILIGHLLLGRTVRLWWFSICGHVQFMRAAMSLFIEPSSAIDEPRYLKELVLGRSTFSNGAVFGFSESRKLSEQENKELFDKCGRFVSGYNEQHSPEGRKSLYGNVVQPTTAPWVAAINIIRDGRVQAIGTGSLISPRHVLTAAHLIGETYSDCDKGETNQYTEKASSYAVYLNVTCINPNTCKRSDRNDTFEQIPVKKIYIRRGYLGNNCPDKSSFYDVAIFELAHDAKFSRDIYPACVSHELPQIGDEAMLYGYGDDPSAVNMLRSGILKSIDTKVGSNCSDFAGSDEPYMMCTYADDRALACAGDSGSGLISKKKLNDESKVEVIGILSAGEACEIVFEQHRWDIEKNRPLKEYPDLLIRVSNFNDFFCDCCGICAPGVEKPSGITYDVIE
ncbi:unnamed protein product [Caenorhabditis auriculariae]|uniref:Peptidase S1 domain-containing protein n=1 Tax=Caenorhabditis auriculariae TaxID=2777116 RepID=A0A8S1H4S1_9PELO|nr:unnamed protein product [Caenorhabditis auriculariae]